MSATSDLIQKIYIGYFGRAGDPSGLNYWVEQSAAGLSDAAIAQSFSVQPEATDMYGFLAAPSLNMGRVEFLNSVYQNLFGRDMDDEGEEYWIGQLDAGRPVGGIILDIINGAQNSDEGQDLTIITNKLAVANYYTEKVIAENATWTLEDDQQDAIDVLSEVDDSDASVTAAEDLADELVAEDNAPAGQSFTLTAGVDRGADFTGGAGNDTFTADNTGDDVSSTADSLVGGAGTDTLDIFSDGAAGALPALTSVETLNIYDQDASVTLSSAQDSLTTVNLIRGDGDLTLNLRSNVATVGLTDIVADGSAGVGSEGVVIAAASAATALSVNLNGITAGGVVGVTDEDVDINGAALTTVNVTTSGVASTFDNLDVASAKSISINAGAALTTVLETGSTTASLTITGSAAVSLGQIDDGIDSVDGSAATGAITMTLSANNVDAEFTFGSGNDVITTSDDGFDEDDGFSVNAGAGTGDVLVVAAAADVDTADEGARYDNFEIIRTDQSVDMSLIGGVTALQITGGTSKTYSHLSATQAANITFRAGNTTSTIFAFDEDTKADSITLNLSSTTSTTNVDVVGLSVDNIESVTINATTGTNTTDDTAVAFLANSADEVKTITFTGTADVTLDVISDTLDVVAVTIDASAMTGTADFTLVQTADLVKGSKVTGTINADAMQLGTTLGSTYNGLAGNDRFDTVVATLVADGTDDTVVDGGEGTDTLHIDDNGSTMTDNHFTFLSGLEAIVYDDGGVISLTTGSAFEDAFSDGLSLTVTSLDDAASFSYAGGLYDLDTEIDITSAGLGNAGGEDITVTTGDGDDTVTITAASYVGTAGDSGSFVVSTAAGDDTITVETGTLLAITSSEAITITAGKGQDDVTLVTTTKTTVQSSANFVFAAGDSTTSAADTITGFDVADGTNLSMLLDFAGTGAVSSFSATVDYGEILSHSNSNGVITFDDAANFSSAIVIDTSNLADVLGYLAANTATNDVVAFAYDSDDSGTADATLVYHNGSTDSLVELIGVTGVVGLTATATTTTANYIAIA